MGADRWERPCACCIGEGCHECGNTGWIAEEGRPETHLTSHAAAEFRAYRMLKEFGAWPRGGGWHRQDAKFLEVLEFCSMAARLYRERQEKQEAEKKKLLEEIQKMRKRAGW